VLDYALGLLLVAAPWLFSFSHRGLATWLPVGAGISMIGIALFTDYELGLFPQIPMPVHLSLDVGIGVLLAVAPFAIGFLDHVWAPHLFVGLLVLGAALATDPEPSRSRLPVRVEDRR